MNGAHLRRKMMEIKVRLLEIERKKELIEKRQDQIDYLAYNTISGFHTLCSKLEGFKFVNQVFSNYNYLPLIIQEEQKEWKQPFPENKSVPVIYLNNSDQERLGNLLEASSEQKCELSNISHTEYDTKEKVESETHKDNFDDDQTTASVEIDYDNIEVKQSSSAAF